MISIPYSNRLTYFIRGIFIIIVILSSQNHGKSISYSIASNLTHNLSGSITAHPLNVKSIYRDNKNPTIHTVDSIYISTDKLRYMMDESVIVFGTINSNNHIPNEKKVTITLEMMPSSSKNIQGWTYLFNMLSKENEGEKSIHVIYNSSFFTNKTFFSDTILNTQNSGTYKVTATLDGSNEKAYTVFEVENLFTTISAYIIGSGTIASVMLCCITSFPQIIFIHFI